jgi:hypothetical protein
LRQFYNDERTMKKLTMMLVTAAGLSGCGEMFPQSANEMREMTSSPLVARSSYTINRSAGAVAASMRQLSAKCLNRTTQSSQVYRHGAYGPQSITFASRWQTSVQSNGGRTELAMRLIPIKGGVNEPEEGYIFFVVDAVPSGSATDVSVFSGSVGAGRFNAEIIDWLEGQRSSCPEMPR